MEQTRISHIANALYGGIVGDALGVPIETTARHELSLCSVKNLLGYGRFDEPEGTWSDDTSLCLCTMEALLDGYDLARMGTLFCEWLFNAKWTPRGYVFDAGLTTFLSLDDLHSKRKSVHECGQRDDDDNGNGSLMRMLPGALYFAREPIDIFITRMHEISAITHAHPTSKMACGLYGLMVRALITGLSKEDAYQAAIRQASDYYGSRELYRPSLVHFEAILSGKLATLPQERVRTSGFVVDTLETAIWAFLSATDTRSIIMQAITLGLDTDTNAMAAGGLAGLYYGIDMLPQQWSASLTRKEEIDALISRFVAVT